jgi:hypothetical protein
VSASTHLFGTRLIERRAFALAFAALATLAILDLATLAWLVVNSLALSSTFTLALSFSFAETYAITITVSTLQSKACDARNFFIVTKLLGFGTGDYVVVVNDDAVRVTNLKVGAANIADTTTITTITTSPPSPQLQASKAAP